MTKLMIISGKSTKERFESAEQLMEALADSGYEARIFYFSDYIEYIAEQYYGWNGVKDSVGTKLIETARAEAMQIDKTFWSDAAIKTLKLLSSDYEYFVIPDIYHTEEIEALKLVFETITIRIKGPDIREHSIEESDYVVSYDTGEIYVYDALLEMVQKLVCKN